MCMKQKKILILGANPETVSLIRKAQEIAAERGGKIAFIASVLGTTADWQDIHKQEAELREAGVYVCRTNYRAALLASEIIRLRKEIA